MRRILDNVEDLLVLFLIPALIALLPWSIGFRVLRKVAVSAWQPRRDDSQAAYKSCQRWLPVADSSAWQHAWRIQQWADRADIFLFLLRGNSFLRRYVIATGVWPQTEAEPQMQQPTQAGHLLITFHWGTGIWALNSASRAGRPNAFLSVALDAVNDARYPVANAYSRLRMFVTARAGGLPVIHTGGAVERMSQTIQEGNNVAALVDLVVKENQASLPVTLLGHPAALPRGLIRLAVEEKIPVAVFLCCTDPESGKRLLEITPSSVFTSEDALATFLASELDRALRTRPWAWHFWAGVDKLMRART